MIDYTKRYHLLINGQDMKEFVVGLIFGFFVGTGVGITQYYMFEGQFNKAVRNAQVQRTNEQQVQLDTLLKLCPGVAQKLKQRQ